MILDNYENFIQKILDKLSELGIDVSCLNMDHIGYQASSDEDYDNLASEFDAIGERVSENIVGGRRVGIYRLNTPLKHQQYTIEAIELYAPKNGQICLSGLEHAEFILLASFESFLKKYPLVPWDKSAISQPDFPQIKLRIDQNAQVKFHLTPVLDIVK